MLLISKAILRKRAAGRIRRRVPQDRRSGQSLIFVVVALGLVLAGGMGLAIDSAQLYGHRQMAQAAADAAAQAGILSIYGVTNKGNTDSSKNFGADTSEVYTCADRPNTTPCRYASLNGFGGGTTTDTIDVTFPSSVPGVTLSTHFTPAAIKVLVSRPVSATLSKLLGATSTTVTATATAAIVKGNSPLPMVILHPTLASALNISGGNASIKICGGPQMGLQVNSRNTTAISVSGTVDLSQGGPSDTAANCSGTGSDLGVSGGPTSAGAWYLKGTTGKYQQPTIPTQDPFRDVTAPTEPGDAPAKVTNIPAGTGDCPSTAPKPCTLYSPGRYPDTGDKGIEVKNETAIFKPGIYYIKGSKGFTTGANGNTMMCSTTCGTAPTGFTSLNGMMIYVDTTAPAIDVGGNGSVTLTGSDPNGTYKGILFFVSRTSAQRTHSIGGGGNWSVTGTIYATNCRTAGCPEATSTTYQELQLKGGASSTTLLGGITGQILVDKLSMSGRASVTMSLATAYNVQSVDLVGLVK